MVRPQIVKQERAMGNLRTIKSENFERDGNKVSLTVIVKDEWEDEPKVYECHTNESGCGIWINGKQRSGTSQFAVPESDSGARRAIKNWFRL